MRRRFDDRPLLLSLVALAIAAGASVGMAAVAGFDHVLRAIEEAQPAWLPLILLGRVVSYAGYAIAHWRVVNLRSKNHLTPRTALSVVAFGDAASSLLGGFSIDRRALKGAGAAEREAVVSVLGLGVLEYAVLAPAAWISALTLLSTAGVQKAVTVPWVIGVPVGTALAALGAWRHACGWRPGVGRIGVAVEHGLEALHILAEMLRHPVRNIAAWAGMAFHWAGDILSLWAALVTFGLHPSVAVVILGYATGYVFTPRSLPLAGVGISEVLLPLALMWVGLPLAHAVIAVFAYRIARLVIALPPAMIADPGVQHLLGLHERGGRTLSEP